MKNLSAFWAAAAGVAVGIMLFAVLGAGTIEDSGIFQSLKLGGKTNLISDDGAALTYNGSHYQISSATLTNASTNALTGAGLIVLQTAVPANQTNVAAANPTATVSTTAVNGSAGTFMRSDASPAIPAAFIQANQTNDGTANWSASGTTNSSLLGLATVNGLTATQTVTAADVRFTGTTTSGLRLKSLTTAQKNALTSAAGDMVFDSDLGRFQAYDGAAWHSRVRLDGDTMTGLLAVPGLNYTSATVLTFVATNTVIDLSAATQTFTCIMTANGTFGPSNIADGRNASLFVLNNQATNVTLTITGALGNYPTVVPAGYHAWIDMRGILLNGSNNLHCAGSTYP